MHDELRSFTQRGIPLNRRGFVAASLATTAAVGAAPAVAQTIVTDTQGLNAGPITLPTRDGAIPGYAARPEAPGKYPIVLVIMEISGLSDYIADVCRRLAKLGHFAVASDLYIRQGDLAKTDDVGARMQIVSRTPDQQIMSDLDAAAAWAEATGFGDGGKLAVTGFCRGGRAVWLYAAHNPRLKAAVAWYGHLAGTATELQPRWPIDVVADLKGPVLGLYGGADAGIPVDQVERMREALKAAGKTAEIVVYPGAGHAFHADWRPTNYHPEAAQDGWRRLQAWFKQHGAG